MTPMELLADAKAKFSILLVDDEEQLKVMLKTSLGKYQDLAGASKTIKVTDPVAIHRPAADYFELVVVKDAYGDFVPTNVFEDEAGEYFEFGAGHQWPLTLTYYADLRGADLNAYKLPPKGVGLIQDHLEQLIGAENDDRLARVESVGKMDASRIQTAPDRDTKILAIEESMKSRVAIVPMISIHSRG